MTTHKLLLFSAIIACLLISSCSWITQDHYFSNNDPSSPWKSLFRHGVPSNKTEGYPDTSLAILERSDVKLVVDVSYQEVTFSGPMFLPIFPHLFSSDSDNELIVRVTVDSDNEYVVLPPTNWLLTDLNKDSTYTVIDSYIPPRTVAKQLLWARFPIPGSSLQSIKLDFGNATKNEQVIDIPNLSLTREKGDWRINHFSF
tara:strand:+ start:1433 stop:2032 length:600 start_codon:yes stop_codon:yes gene_type:complete